MWFVMPHEELICIESNLGQNLTQEFVHKFNDYFMRFSIVIFCKTSIFLEAFQTKRLEKKLSTSV